MIDTSDPLARLRAANPVPAARVALLEPDPVLFQAIVAGGVEWRVPASAGRHRRRRRLVPALAVASLLSGAVAYAVLRDEVTKPANVACFEQAASQGDATVVAVDAEGPLAACAELWRRGLLGPTTEVPPLAECTLPSGVVGVFPVADCASLDLPPVPTTTTPPAPPAPPGDPPADVSARILAFRNATVGQFLGSPCVTPQQGTDIVGRELERAGLSGWTIVADGFTADRPCATLSIQADVRQVILAPAPPRR